MKNKGTIIISCIFFILLAYVYFYEIKGEAARIIAQYEEGLIYLFDVQDVNKIEFTRSDTVYLFEKDESGWNIKQPVGYKGDGPSIDGLLNVFSTSNNEDVVNMDSDNLSNYGFGEKSVNFSITLENGEKLSLEMGGLNPTETNAYARIPGSSDIFLTSVSLHKGLNFPLYNYRDKTIFDFDPADVNMINIFMKDTEYKLKRRDEQEWDMLKPLVESADRHKIDLILSSLSTQRINKFSDETHSNLKKYNLANPENYTELLIGDNNQKMVLYIGDRINEDFYVRDNEKNIVYRVDSSMIKLCLPELFDLRSKEVNVFDKDKVDYFELVYPNEKYIFTKEDSTNIWYQVFPDYRETYTEKVKVMVSDIYWLRPEGFIDNIGNNRRKYGLDHPIAEVTLKIKGEEVLRVKLGKQAGDKYYFYNENKSQLFLIRSSFVPRLVVPRAALIKNNK